jgi:amino acid transporter
VRGIRRWDLVALVVNAVIGAGIFGLPARVFELAGPWSLLAFAACAAVVTLIVLCFAELGSRFDRTGGPYLYVGAAFGPLAGFTVGWLIWLARVTAFAALCNLLVGYLGHFWPAAGLAPWRPLIVTAIVIALAAVNVRGIRQAALVGNAFTIGKLAPLVLFVAVGAFFVDPGRLALSRPPELGRFSEAALLLVFAFTGFETATIPAGETRAPRRDLPFALLTAMAAVTLLYVAIQVVCIGTLPELAASQRPLADAALGFLGPLGAAVVAAGALVSVTGTLNSIMIAGPRLPYAMAAAGQLPPALAATHPRFHTPHVSILLTAGVVLVLTLQGTFIGAVTMSTIIRLVSYAATCAALPALRRRDRAAAAGAPAAFRVPAGGVVAAASLGLCGWLLSSGAWREGITATAAAAIGLALHGAHRLTRRGASGRGGR